MERIVIGIGALLALVGVAAYVGTGMSSLTALIPTIIGVPIAVLGVAARDPRQAQRALWLAVVIGVLGVLGSLRVLPDLMAMVTGGEVARPAAVAAQGVTLALCAILVALIVPLRRAVRQRLAQPV